MIEFSSSLKLNEIHIVDSLFNDDPKMFFHGSPNFGEGQSENSGKMGNNKDIYYYANRRVVNFEREYQPLPPWYQNPCDPSIFQYARANFKKKNEKKL